MEASCSQSMANNVETLLPTETRFLVKRLSNFLDVVRSSSSNKDAF